MHQLHYNKIDQKTHFMSGASPYMFQQQGAIIRQFLSNRGLKSPTIISGTIHPHFPSCLKMLKYKLHIHTAVTHKRKPPLLHINSRYTSWAVYANIRSNT
jgi:hypothetical protein